MGEVGAEEMMDWDKLQGVGNGGEEKILVLVRLRPLSENEILHDEVSDWECINSTTILYRNSLQERSGLPTATSFDRVFRGDNTTLEVYNEGGIKDIALSVVGGINSTIFAYGQTSSGKTYTMNGITEYAAADILEYIKQHSERAFLLKFSAIEIYNEVVRDLLNADNNTALRLLDDPERGTVIDGLTEETLRDWDHLKELLSICKEQRQIGETLLNEASSRSHQILRFTIESSAREFMGNSNSTTLAASVNFVDLAGSERASQALSVGQRLKEGCHINRSLLTLGTVIRKLSKGRQGHINYRDSKLTRILQPALGGNARTAIICTLSPARSHVEQSRNTILFASCAKEVSTNARVNIVMSDKALVKHLQKEVARLESELRTPVSATTCDHVALLKKKDAQIEKLEKENKELKKQLDLAHSRIEDLLHGIEDYNGSHVTNGGLVSNGTSGPLLSENSQDNYTVDQSIESGKDFEEISMDEAKQGKPDEPVSPSTTCSGTCSPMLSKSRNNRVVEPLASSASSRNDDEKKMQGVYKMETPLKQFNDASSPSVQSNITMVSGSSTLQRSRSCKANIMLNSFDSEMAEVEQNETTPTTVLELNFTGGTTTAPRKHWKLPPVIYGATHGSALSRNDSRCSGYSSFIDSAMEDEIPDEDIPTLGSFVAGLKELAKTKCDNQSEQQGAVDEENSIDIDLKNWPARFNKLRNQIIELWEACHVSLVHRTYFLLLIKQEFTDSIYVEVEHRRLTFLKERFSRGNSVLQDGKVLTLASSKKALLREREMLSRMFSKKYTEEERKQLYEEWGIAVRSKRRRLQLARRLWNDNGNLHHAAKSATIVGKLIGFFDHGHALEEMLGLKFAPLPQISRRSFGWKNSVTSLRY